MKYNNTIEWLQQAANYCDESGMTQYADAIDHAIRIIVAQSPPPTAQEVNQNAATLNEVGAGATPQAYNLARGGPSQPKQPTNPEYLKKMEEAQKQYMVDKDVNKWNTTKAQLAKQYGYAPPMTTQAPQKPGMSAEEATQWLSQFK